MIFFITNTLNSVLTQESETAMTNTPYASYHRGIRFQNLLDEAQQANQHLEYLAEPKEEDFPTPALQYHWDQTRHFLKDVLHMENAKKFIDFITSKEAQSIIASQLHRRSVRDDVDPPVGLLPKDQIKIIDDNEQVVEKNKKSWLDKFKDIFTSVQ